MIYNSNKVWIKKRINQSTFYKTNMKVLGEESRRLGSNATAVKAMLINGDELKVLMPSILGIDPKSTTSNWDKAVSNYWHSLTVDIYDKGKELEIGFIYDFNDTTTFFDNVKRKDYISKLTGVKDDRTLMEYVEGSKDGKPNVPENEKYKYAMPINVEDYLLYRYCQSYHDVANNIDSVDKSPNIRFYLFSDKLYKIEADKKLNLEKKAMSLFLKVIANSNEVDNVLYTLCNKVDSLKGINIKTLDESDKHIHLKNIMNEKPQLFISTVEDKNLLIKANIERYINAGIWKRLPNSDIIVDTDNAEITIGNNVDEAVSFMSNDANKERLNVYVAKFKGLKL